MSESSIVGVVFCCVGLLIPGIMAAISLFIQRRMAAINTWPTSAGQVVSSRIVMRTSSEGGSTPYPEVVYSYRVGGIEYHANKIHVGGEIGGMGVRKTLARYPVGTMVAVYYNPANPGDAVLERKAPMIWFLLGLGLIFFLGFGGVGFVVFAYPLLKTVMPGLP